MKNFIFPMIILAMSVTACSSPEPPRRFLTARMGIPYTADGQKKAEQLKMRPVDLFNLFDQNLKGKKWKRIHENSWAMIIDGRDPASGSVSRMTITLAVDPELNDTVVATEIHESDRPYPPEEIAKMIRELDNAFTPGK